MYINIYFIILFTFLTRNVIGEDENIANSILEKFNRPKTIDKSANVVPSQTSSQNSTQNFREKIFDLTIIGQFIQKLKGLHIAIGDNGTVSDFWDVVFHIPELTRNNDVLQRFLIYLRQLNMESLKAVLSGNLQNLTSDDLISLPTGLYRNFQLNILLTLSEGQIATLINTIPDADITERLLKVIKYRKLPINSTRNFLKSLNVSCRQCAIIEDVSRELILNYPSKENVKTPNRIGKCNIKQVKEYNLCPFMKNMKNTGHIVNLTRMIDKQTSNKDFIDFFKSLSNDSLLLEKYPTSDLLLILRRYLRQEKRPFHLTLNQLSRIRPFLPLLTAYEFQNVDWTDLKYSHLETFNNERLSLFTKQFLIKQIKIHLVKRDHLNESELTQIPMALLPGLQINDFISFSQHLFMAKLRIFSSQAHHMSLPQKAVIINKIKPLLEFALRDLVTDNGVKHLISLFTPIDLRKFVYYLLSWKNNLKLMNDVRKLPKYILRMWMVFGRKYFHHGIWDLSSLQMINSAVLGITCKDVQLLVYEDLFNFLQLYHKFGEERDNLLMSPDVKQCLKTKILEYKNIMLPNLHGKKEILNSFSKGEIAIMREEILSEFSIQELKMLSASVCPFAFKLIGRMSSNKMLRIGSLEKLENLSLAALQCLNATDIKRQLPYNHLSILGELLFYLPPKTLDLISAPSFKKYLQMTQKFKRNICLGKKTRFILSKKLQGAFGNPANWSSANIHIIGNLLIIIPISELSKINLSLSRDLALNLIQDYPSFHKISEDSSKTYAQVCAELLGQTESVEYLDEIEAFLVFMRKVKTDLKTSVSTLSKKSRNLCEELQIAGMLANTYTVKDLDSFSAEEFLICLEIVGQINWPKSQKAFIWKHIKKLLCKENSLSAETLIQMNHLVTALDCSEFKLINFSESKLEILTVLGQQTEWTAKQLRCLGRKYLEVSKWIPETTIKVEEIMALRNILCGLSPEVLVNIFTHSMLLRDSFAVLMNLHNCSREVLSTIADVAYQFQSFGPLSDLENEEVIMNILPDLLKKKSLDSTGIVPLAIGQQFEYNAVIDLACAIAIVSLHLLLGIVLN